MTSNIMKIVRRFDRPLVKKIRRKIRRNCVIFSGMRRSDMKIYIDGKFHDRGEAKISVLDHGLLYGTAYLKAYGIYNRRSSN